MKKILKRVAIVLGSVVLLLAIVAAVVFWTAFGHNRPIVDREVLAPGVTIVKDGFVSVAMLDVAPDKVALVDCGNDKDAKATIAALADRKLTASSVVAIFRRTVTPITPLAAMCSRAPRSTRCRTRSHWSAPPPT